MPVPLYAYRLPNEGTSRHVAAQQTAPSTTATQGAKNSCNPLLHKLVIHPAPCATSLVKLVPGRCGCPDAASTAASTHGSHVVGVNLGTESKLIGWAKAQELP